MQQEIGYAFSSHKPLIPLVEKGVDSKDLGSLQGREYIEYDSEQPQRALVRRASYVKSLKLKKEQQEKALLTAGALVAFLLLLQGGKR